MNTEGNINNKAYIISIVTNGCMRMLWAICKKQPLRKHNHEQMNTYTGSS